MILFFVTRKHSYTLRAFKQDWAGAVRSLIKVASYDRLPQLQRLHAGTVVFTDLERLTPAQMKLSMALCGQLEAGPVAPQILNHPARALCRYELLAALHEHGINDFRCSRATSLEPEPRYPVFLRRENDHEGASTKLLPDQARRDRALLGLLAMGRRPENILQTEFIDTKSDDGLFRKYAAFRIGDQIIPGHQLFSREWLLKDTDISNDDTTREKTAYMEGNPHREQLMAIFELADIEFGRIDYGFANGRIQVWEINTNPTLIKPASEYKPAELEIKELLAVQLREAFRAIDGPEDFAPLEVGLKLGSVLP